MSLAFRFRSNFTDKCIHFAKQYMICLRGLRDIYEYRSHGHNVTSSGQNIVDTLSNRYIQIDGYVQNEQYSDVQNYYFYKHDLLFKPILQQLELLTSGTSCMHTIPLLYKFSLLRIFSMIFNFSHQHTSNFTAIDGY